MPRAKGIETITTNRKAFHEYFILDTFEAGLELSGAEIKSIRLKQCTIDAAFVRVDKGQAFIHNMSINPYIFNTHGTLEPARTRRLLMHIKEINKIASHSDIKGQTIVPLEVYLKDGWAKVKIGLAKGKKLYDKRETIKKRDLLRDTDRGFKSKIKM